MKKIFVSKENYEMVLNQFEDVSEEIFKYTKLMHTSKNQAEVCYAIQMINNLEIEREHLLASLNMYHKIKNFPELF